MKYIVYLFTAALLVWIARYLIHTFLHRHSVCSHGCGAQCSGCPHAERPHLSKKQN